MEGWLAKYSTASSTLIISTSPMLFSLKRTASVSGLKRAPRHVSQVTFTSGRKLISIFFSPCPSQVPQRPPPVLNEKRDAA